MVVTERRSLVWSQRVFHKINTHTPPPPPARYIHAIMAPPSLLSTMQALRSPMLRPATPGSAAVPPSTALGGGAHAGGPGPLPSSARRGGGAPAGLQSGGGDPVPPLALPGAVSGQPGARRCDVKCAPLYTRVPFGDEVPT